MRLWLHGSQGAVRIVFLVKWKEVDNSNKVKGDIEVWKLINSVEQVTQTVVSLHNNSLSYHRCSQLTLLKTDIPVQMSKFESPSMLSLGNHSRLTKYTILS